MSVTWLIHDVINCGDHMGFADPVEMLMVTFRGFADPVTMMMHDVINCGDHMGFADPVKMVVTFLWIC